MITGLSVISAVVLLFIGWYIGNKMNDTFGDEILRQIRSTIMGVMLIVTTISALYLLVFGFYLIYSNLLNGA